MFIITPLNLKVKDNKIFQTDLHEERNKSLMRKSVGRSLNELSMKCLLDDSAHRLDSIVAEGLNID